MTLKTDQLSKLLTIHFENMIWFQLLQSEKALSISLCKLNAKDETHQNNYSATVLLIY